MHTKRLGATEIRVPEIGLGTWNYKGGLEPLRRGIDLGANLIDTAEIYGTEGVVGQATKEVRGQVFLASKVSGQHLKYDDVLRACEGSLRHLDVEQIDLYQVHWSNRTVPITETMRAMEFLADSGLIRHIGVSNFSVHELKDAQRSMKHHSIVSNQVLYNLYRRAIEAGLLPYCIENQVTVIAYTPLASGKLAGRKQLFTGRRVRTLRDIANAEHKTIAQIALNWLICHDNVIAIPKSDSLERTVENCGASGWRLSTEEMEQIDAAFC